MRKTFKILLGAIQGAIAGIVAGMVIQAMLVGIFWFAIFGDNKWPSWAEALADEGFVVVACLIGIVIGLIISIRKNQNTAVKKKD